MYENVLVPHPTVTFHNFNENAQSDISATGSTTTIYNVESQGDPNEKLETTDMETQYFIKWKGWSHLHNTWESQQTLNDQKANGMKKVENFMKRQAELDEW